MATIDDYNDYREQIWASTWISQEQCCICARPQIVDLTMLRYVPGGSNSQETWPESFEFTCTYCGKSQKIYSGHIPESISRALTPKHHS